MSSPTRIRLKCRSEYGHSNVFIVRKKDIYWCGKYTVGYLAHSVHMALRDKDLSTGESM